MIPIYLDEQLVSGTFEHMLNVIYCYSLGVISSRKIAKMCESKMTVKAFSEWID